MRVKAVDIARELGLSKATVSLALNDKPGVSPKTKQAIEECRKRLELMGAGGQIKSKQEESSVIKIIVASRDLKIVKNAEMDLWTDVKTVFDMVAKSWGCSPEISYFDINQDSAEKMAGECNRTNVSGIVLFGTELYPSDVKIFRDIKKPMVIYDSDIESDRHSCVVVDNVGGVRKAVDYLVAHGKKNIIYLSRDIKIYNYIQRRKGFAEALREHNLPYNEKEQLVCMGEKIDSIYQNMKIYLERSRLPDAFILESYHLSIGCIRACREKNIRIPEQVSIVGIDELPDYMTGEHQLTAVRIPHTERAKMVMTMLWHEMHDSSDFKSKVFTNCRFVEGNTVE